MKVINYSILTFLVSVTLHLHATAPSVGLNFTSVDATNCFGAQFISPQQPTGGVGPTQYIVVTAQSLRSFNKLTGLPDGALNIDTSTFAFSGGIKTSGDDFLIYDRFAQRWIYSNEGSNITSLNFVVSNSAIVTPATQWAFYEVAPATINPLGGGSAGSLDYNQPGFDQNAYYNGVGTFNSVGTFLGSSLTVVSQSSLLAGDPNIVVFPGLFPEVVNNVQEGYACPATNFDSNPQYGYFLWTIYDAPNSTSGDTIQFYRILDAGSNTPTLGPLVTISVPEFAYNGLFASHKGNLFGALGLLQTGGGTIAPYPHVRNHQLYLAHDIQVDNTGTASTTGDRIGIRWYQIDMTGDLTGQGLGTETPSTVPVLIQSGTLFDDSATNPLFYFTSAIMTNKNGDMCISFNQSGNNAYLNAGYAFRSSTDLPNTLQTPVLVTNTTSAYNYCPNLSLEPGPNCQRWGDQSSVVTDPDNDTTFWITQPWAALSNGWGIQAVQVIPAAA